MNRFLLLHNRYQTNWSDRFAIFFDLVKKHLGFTSCVWDRECVLPHDANIVLLYGWDSVPLSVPFGKFSKTTRFIWYAHDLHWGRRAYGAKAINDLVARCDLVLTPYYDYFAKACPDYISKAVFFPHFFAPHERYVSIHFSLTPRMRCLLSGYIMGKYPIRKEVLRIVKRDLPVSKLIDVLQHPRHKTAQFFTRKKGGEIENYARTLSEYFCCVTDSSQFKLGLTRYFEVPAAGSLLLADKCADIDRAGLVPMKHYISVTEQNVAEKIYSVLNNSADYQTIRKAGMEFVRAHHSVNNRVDQLKKILEELE